MDSGARRWPLFGLVPIRGLLSVWLVSAVFFCCLLRVSGADAATSPGGRSARPCRAGRLRPAGPVSRLAKFIDVDRTIHHWTPVACRAPAHCRRETVKHQVMTGKACFRLTRYFMISMEP